MDGTELLAVAEGGAAESDEGDDDVVTAGNEADEELDDPLTTVAESGSESAIPLSSADLSATYASAQGEVYQPPDLAVRETLERPGPRARRQRALGLLASAAALLAGGVALFVTLRVFKDPKPLPRVAEAAADARAPSLKLNPYAVRLARPDAGTAAADLAPARDLSPAPDLKRAAPPPAKFGVLRVNTQIEGGMGWAYVTLDGRRIKGQTPLKVYRLAAGIHTLQIERRGYRTITEKVRIRAGQETRVSYTLQR